MATLTHLYKVHFKLVDTALTKEYYMDLDIPVDEFIERATAKILRDDDIRGLGITNIELVPLMTTTHYPRQEDAPALQPSLAQYGDVFNIHNEYHRYFYIRPTSTARAASALTDPPSDSSTRDNCVICMTNPREIAFTPCGHLCVCRQCNNNPLMNLCPVCRNPHSQPLQIFSP